MSEALAENGALVQQRHLAMLKSALGPDIVAALEDPDVIEVLLNPDGCLWLDRLSTGRSPTGLTLPKSASERIIRLVAACIGTEVTRSSPIVSAELPGTGERFEGVLPPIVPAPTFAIRKRAAGVIGLDRYMTDGILSRAQAEFLRYAIHSRLNILIAGGTSTGKTTLANALLQEIAKTHDRVIVLEDTVELQCVAEDHVPLRTQAGHVSMAELVRSTLRLRPDRIIVGEVRGGEALDLLKAWGTGHPGGIATIHAGSAMGALMRLEQLIQEVIDTAPKSLIAETLDVIVFIEGRGADRRVREIVRVTGLTDHGYELSPISNPTGEMR